MNLFKFCYLIVWVVLSQFAFVKGYEAEDYLKVVEKYIEKEYGSINYSSRVVIDSMVYIYIDQTAYDIPISSLDSTFILDKDTLEIIHSNVRIKTELQERYTDDGPLPLEKLPEFINEKIYEGKYKVDEKKIKVIQNEKFKNHYNIDGAPFILIEEKEEYGINYVEVEMLYEPVPKSNLFELAYFINYMDEDYNRYTISLFAYTQTTKKISKNGY